MFARTKRLLLRPGWMEDAPALAAALADARIARAVSHVPLPYTQEHAREFLSRPPIADQPRLLIFERGDGAPDLIGGIGLTWRAGRMTIGYWIRPDRWNRGFATEAGRAAIAMADMLGHRDLFGSVFIDNPASGAVLAKLGFVATGEVGLCHSAGRTDPGLCRTMHRRASAATDLPAPIAA
jgi:RimJ/RimL family protein N-acetyltransferase